MEVVLSPLGQQAPLRLFLHLARQRGKQSEVRVHRLEVARIGVAEVPVQTAEHGGWRWDGRGTPLQTAREVDAGEEPGAERLGVALDAGELPGKEEPIVVPGRERGTET